MMVIPAPALGLVCNYKVLIKHSPTDLITYIKGILFVKVFSATFKTVFSMRGKELKSWTC